MQSSGSHRIIGFFKLGLCKLQDHSNNLRQVQALMKKFLHRQVKGLNLVSETLLLLPDRKRGRIDHLGYHRRPRGIRVDAVGKH